MFSEKFHIEEVFRLFFGVCVGVYGHACSLIYWAWDVYVDFKVGFRGAWLGEWEIISLIFG